ncbi:MAG: CocE/NonD family hydrolase [Dehalococcoidales bacterium]|nr:CocE/NonD family hydrolase [Dehalococcoidales bacterium]
MNGPRGEIMSFSLRIEKDVSIEMRDGILLAGEVYRPDDNGKYPAVLMRTPYGGDILSGSGYFKAVQAVQSGYAVVVAYVRGRFGSQGEYDLSSPQHIEGPDCYDTVEWVATQPWCDGNVGMVGESALGTVQWRTARETPPHLKAIAPGLAGVPGDAGPETSDAPVNINIAVSLLQMLAGDVLDKMDARGEDSGTARRMLAEVKENPSLALNYLPLRDVPNFDIPGIREIWRTSLQMSGSVPTSDPSAAYPFGNVMVPGLTYTAWYDPFSRNSFRSYYGMIEQGGNEYARKHQHLLAGPWCHCNPQRVLGDIDFGPQADGPGSGASNFVLSFFDRYLKGKDIALPAARYFTMGSNTWHESTSWPPPGIEWQRYFLHSSGVANSCSGNGVLDRTEPGNEPPDTYTYDPLYPVPTAGGRGGLAENGFIYGPIDQVHIERREDVLCYTSPELEKDVEVTGPLELHLFASSSCVDTDFAVKLVDVLPDGRAYNVADGIVRAQYRNSFTSPELLKPGEVTEFIIRLGHTSQVFRTGHRIRIDITSSNFPTFDRNMNTGNPIGVDAEGIAALQTIYHRTGYASYIDFPVIPVQ